MKNINYKTHMYVVYNAYIYIIYTDGCKVVARQQISNLSSSWPNQQNRFLQI